MKPPKLGIVVLKLPKETPGEEGTGAKVFVLKGLTLDNGVGGPKLKDELAVPNGFGVLGSTEFTGFVVVPEKLKALGFPKFVEAVGCAKLANVFSPVVVGPPIFEPSPKLKGVLFSFSLFVSIGPPILNPPITPAEKLKGFLVSFSVSLLFESPIGCPKLN